MGLGLWARGVLETCECLLQFRDPGWSVVFPFRSAPNGTGPGVVVDSTADDMDVQLPDDIAQRGDSQFLNREGLLHELRHQANLPGQARVVLARKAVNFDGHGLRDEDEPRQQRIVHQQEMRQVEFGDEVAVGLQSGVDLELGHGYLALAGVEAANGIGRVGAMTIILVRRGVPMQCSMKHSRALHESFSLHAS